MSRVSAGSEDAAWKWSTLTRSHRQAQTPRRSLRVSTRSIKRKDAKTQRRKGERIFLAPLRLCAFALKNAIVMLPTGAFDFLVERERACGSGRLQKRPCTFRQLSSRCTRCRPARDSLRLPPANRRGDGG